jgi:hypothetical protein
MTTPPVQPDRNSLQRTRAIKVSEATYDEADFKGLLSDEYKILQDKIDKIGGFRFTIKGWSVTAVIAASAAASASKSLSTVCTISLGLVLMLSFFFWLEFEQVRLSRLFGSRAGRLEDAFRRISRGKGKEVHAIFPVPYTAHELVLSSHRPRPLHGRGQQHSATLQSPTPWADRWHVCRQAHIGFYILFALLALAPLLPHHRSIGTHWRDLKDRITHSRQASPEVPSPPASARPK